MTDARKFCLGTFIGMGLTAAVQNHGLVAVKAGEGSHAILVMGIMLGCFTILTFGSRGAPKP